MTAATDPTARCVLKLNVAAALIASSGTTLDDGDREIEAREISGTGETAGGERTGAGADAMGGFTLDDGDGAGDGELIGGWTNCEEFDDDFSGDGDGASAEEPNRELCEVVNPMKNVAIIRTKKPLYLYDDAIAVLCERGKFWREKRQVEFVREKELRLAGYS